MRGGPTSGGPGQLESPVWEAPNGPVGTGGRGNGFVFVVVVVVVVVVGQK